MILRKQEPMLRVSTAARFDLILVSREEMAQSSKTRCREWVDNASAGMKSWVRDPQPSVFKHTFRDRQQEAEIGPSNGHVSGRKYIPRCITWLCAEVVVVFS